MTLAKLQRGQKLAQEISELKTAIKRSEKQHFLTVNDFVVYIQPIHSGHEVTQCEQATGRAILECMRQLLIALEKELEEL